MVEKKKINVHAFTVHIYTIAIIVLLLFVAVLGAKYWHLKWSVKNFTQSTIWMNSQSKATGQISDYGVIIGETASQHISSSDLQSYVTTISKALNRDIVIMDSSKKILADTVSVNKGTTYSYDANNEIEMTIKDGKTRKFEERSTDYPSGVLEVVVPMKDVTGDTIGAVLVSDSKIK